MKSKMSLIIVFSWGFMLYAQNVSLTLTQDNIALVNETRSVSLKNGLNLVVLKDLPLMLEPTSLIFSFNNQSVKLREQYFAYDLKNTQTMLNKSIGNYIRILHPELGTVQGTLISAKEGMLVIETATGICRYFPIMPVYNLSLRNRRCSKHSLLSPQFIVQWNPRLILRYQRTCPILLPE